MMDMDALERDIGTSAALIWSHLDALHLAGSCLTGIPCCSTLPSRIVSQMFHLHVHLTFVHCQVDFHSKQTKTYDQLSCIIIIIMK